MPDPDRLADDRRRGRGDRRERRRAAGLGGPLRLPVARAPGQRAPPLQRPPRRPDPPGAARPGRRAVAGGGHRPGPAPSRRAGGLDLRRAASSVARPAGAGPLEAGAASPSAGPSRTSASPRPSGPSSSVASSASATTAAASGAGTSWPARRRGRPCSPTSSAPACVPGAPDRDRHRRRRPAAAGVGRRLRRCPGWPCAWPAVERAARRRWRTALRDPVERRPGGGARCRARRRSRRVAHLGPRADPVPLTAADAADALRNATALLSRTLPPRSMIVRGSTTPAGGR